MGFGPDGRAQVFRYAGLTYERASGLLLCRYELDDVEFVERIQCFPSDPGLADERSVLEAARIVHLLAGVSYYKAGAPPVIEVPDGLTPAERALLEAFYLDGLGEFAFVNDLDLSGVRIEAPDRAPVTPRPGPSGARPLVPFGGGIDSIVTVEGVRAASDDIALFVVSKEDARYEAIESPAAVTGLPIVRVDRRLDDRILRSRELGYLNGHVPVTGVLSALAVLAAVLEGRDAVVMSNEWSASMGNVERDGRMVNHQWSKSLAFEDLFRAALGEAIGTPVDYFSWLRPRSELWVAERFAALGRYHRSFHSCNRGFHIDPAKRLDHWCGRCDKCCFIDLILAPFVPAPELRNVFGGAEPLADETLVDQFRALAGISDDAKPFECVGDVDECRIALLMAARRPDRGDSTVLAGLAAEVTAIVPGDVFEHARRLFGPLGPDRTPERYAPRDLLV